MTRPREGGAETKIRGQAIRTPGSEATGLTNQRTSTTNGLLQ